MVGFATAGLPPPIVTAPLSNNCRIYVTALKLNPILHISIHSNRFKVLSCLSRPPLPPFQRLWNNPFQLHTSSFNGCKPNTIIALGILDTVDSKRSAGNNAQLDAIQNIIRKRSKESCKSKSIQLSCLNWISRSHFEVSLVWDFVAVLCRNILMQRWSQSLEMVDIERLCLGVGQKKT